MLMPISSRIIYALTAIFMALTSHLADYNESHLFNPDWPPHAKFHDGMTLSLSILLGLMTILFTWRKTGERLSAVIAASGFEGVFCICFFTAALYPNASYNSHPEATETLPLGIPPQLYICFTMLALIALASWLALRRGACWVS
jgi:hypothetical protein